MKTYSIGRDLNCDIVINDSTDVISRCHALLNITPSGKMTIIDQSSNGTYVNGIRISQNVPVPVTRKDIVSLAHVAKLDWNQIPKSYQWINYAVGAVAIVVIVLGLVFGVKYLKSNSDDNGGTNPETIEKVDSTAIKQKEAAKNDSIKKASEKARQDSIKASKKETQPKRERKEQKKEDKSKKSKDKSKSNENKDKSKDKDNSSQSKKRAIG